MPFRFFRFACPLAILLAGCGPSGPPLGIVHGTITLDGEPLHGARVEFQPQGEGGSPSYGITDAAGHYEANFSVKRPGAMVGTHTVRVSTYAQSPGGDSTKDLPERVPPQYNSNSELQVEVKAGENTHDFPLVGDLTKS